MMENGCGRSIGVAVCGYDEDPAFFVDVSARARARLVCVLLPKTKLRS